MVFSAQDAPESRKLLTIHIFLPECVHSWCVPYLDGQTQKLWLLPGATRGELAHTGATNQAQSKRKRDRQLCAGLAIDAMQPKPSVGRFTHEAPKGDLRLHVEG